MALHLRRAIGIVCVVLSAVLPLPGAEIVVLSETNWDTYVPGGKEADCILGDYVLKSDRIWAVVAQPRAWRHANMTVRQVGGCLIDLTTTDRPNDQLSAFYPGMRQIRYWFDPSVPDQSTTGQVEIVQARGPRVHLRIVGKLLTKSRPTAVVAELHYELADGDPYLEVRTVFRNTGKESVSFRLEDDVRADNFDAKARNAVHDYFWVHDRYFDQAYLVLAPGHRIRSQSDATRLSRLEYLPDGADRGEITLEPGKEYTLTRLIVPARNLLQAREVVCLRQQQALRVYQVRVVEQPGQPVGDAEIEVRCGDETYGYGRVDAQGHLRVPLPCGQSYELILRAPGCRTQRRQVQPRTPGAEEVRWEVPAIARVVARITDNDGQPIPCKVQFKALGDLPNPNWGPPAAAHGVANLYYSHDGRFEVSLLPGEYEVTVSYGPEYDAERVRLQVGPGARVPLHARLRRVVQSPGWISADFHSHSSPSGDNTAEQRGRVLNLLCEHIEFAPCTEHNRLDTYVPHLRALGVEKLMGTCTGIELTGQPLPLNHHNAFPLHMKARTQDNGAPQPDDDPQKQIRRLFEWDSGTEKLVQQNHPDIGWLFFDKDGNGERDEGYRLGFPYMHVIEVHPIHDILSMRPVFSSVGQGGRREIRNHTAFNWLQLLNLGYRIPGVVNTDAHYNFHGSGGLRNWIRCDVETPGDIPPLNIVRHARRGHIVMSTGPYLEVKAGNAIPGDDAHWPGGKGTLHIRVQCTNWLDIDRVQILVNGRPLPHLNFTRTQHPERFHKGVVKFDQKIPVELSSDAHLIVVAIGEQTQVGDIMGPQWGRQNPVAISNPIFVDVDGNGFKPNGDLLDAPIPTRGGRSTALRLPGN